MVSSSPSNLTVREVLNRQIQEYTDRFVGGSLTSNGIQYSPIIRATTASSDVVVFTRTITPPKAGTITYTDFGLTAEFSTASGVLSGTTMVFKWQAKNSEDSSWADLHSGINMLVSTGWVAGTVQGYYTSAVTVAPFDVRLTLNCGDLNGQARVHNASYAKVAYY